MKTLIVIILIAVVAYVGWQVYENRVTEPIYIERGVLATPAVPDRSPPFNQGKG